MGDTAIHEVYCPDDVDPAFQAFPKIPRLNREIIITEKIDGTNAQILILPSWAKHHPDAQPIAEIAVHRILGAEAYKDLGVPFGIPIAYDTVKIYAGSRRRWITPEDDNYGFAAWVRDHAEELSHLGPGRHYGEWWGLGIQRGYGLKEKRFSLFNVSKWSFGNPRPPRCCFVVPLLFAGFFAEEHVTDALQLLRVAGSLAAPGFSRPEGIIVYHSAANQLFKVTLENDGKPKGQA